MKPDQIKAILGRLGAATPGPWEKAVDDHGPRVGFEVGIWVPGVGEFGEWVIENVTSERPETDAEFIAHAREDVPALLDEVQRLRAGAASALDALERGENNKGGAILAALLRGDI